MLYNCISIQVDDTTMYPKCIMLMLYNVDDVIIGNLANVPDTSGRGGNVRNVHNHISNNFF